MLLTLQDLKVDQTVLVSDNAGILVSNINIPESEFVNLDAVIERTRAFIIQTYTNLNATQYQVCATYELKHIETGDTRQWTGSFNPRGNQYNTLCQFQQFTLQYNNRVKQACSEANVYRRLRFYHVPTNWVFHKLTSFIISVQSPVSLVNPAIILQYGGGGGRQRRSRIHRSFYLP
jgi:hypothetical protein